METFENIQKSLTTEAWFVEIIVLVLFGFVFNFIFTQIYRRLHPYLVKKHKAWETAFLTSLYRPLKWFVWALVASFCFGIIAHWLKSPSLISLIRPIRALVSVGTLLWFALSLSHKVEENLLHMGSRNLHRMDETSIHAIGKLMRVFIMVTCAIFAIQGMGFPVSGLVAVGGFGGAAVGFAAKDLIANFFGGLTLHLDRPFSLGDWIRSPDRQIEGIVEYIGWRSTRVQTFDKLPIFIPNSIFTTIAIENPSRMSHRRIKNRIGIRYDDAPKMAAILKDVRQMFHDHPELAKDKRLAAHFVEFGPSSLNFQIECFTKTVDYMRFQEVQEDIFLKIIDIITNHHAECAFPTVTVNLPETTQKPTLS